VRKYEVRDELSKEYKPYNTEGFYEFVRDYVDKGIYGRYLIEKYSEEEIRDLGRYMEHDPCLG